MINPLNDRMITDIMENESASKVEYVPSTSLDTKLLDLLTSKSSEDVVLGLTICKQMHPLLWSTLVGVSGVFTPTDGIDKRALAKLFAYSGITIGSKVRYRLDNSCPTMIVTDLKVVTSMFKLLNEGFVSYHIRVNCKYFNKSSQTFISIEDRIECFEIIIK